MRKVNLRRDRHLGSELAQPDPKWVLNVCVERLPEATHWVQHDAAERVNELLTEFLGAAASSQGRRSVTAIRATRGLRFSAPRPRAMRG